MFAVRAQFEKCSQVFSELYLSRQPFGPKETSVCHELSSVSCYVVRKNYSQGARHGRSQEQYDHFQATESTRHAKNENFSSIAERFQKDGCTEIRSSPPYGQKNIVNIWIRSWQMISHLQQREKSARGVKTMIPLASTWTNEEMGRLPASGGQSFGSSKTSGESKSVYP